MKRYYSTITDAVNVFSKQMTITSLRISNVTAQDAYIQFFDSSSVPTLGTGISSQILVRQGYNYCEVMPPNVKYGGIFQSFSSGLGIGAATTVDGSTPLTNGVLVTIEYYI